jgi:protein-disulfide isomerase
VKKNYIDSGKVRFYSMNLPLEIHPNAMLAAQAGRCAADQEHFWPMHDRMQRNPDRLRLTDLVGYATEFGLDTGAFQECVQSGKHQQQIEEEAREAAIKGARGTPAFVIGRSTSEGVEGELVIGAESYGPFEEHLKRVVQ